MFNRKLTKRIADLEEKVRIFEELTQKLLAQNDNLIREMEIENNQHINIIKQNMILSKLTDLQDQTIIELRQEIETLKEIHTKQHIN